VPPEAVLGIVSLIFWSLIIVISIKYAILIMRADNHGEGGILALLALVSPRRAKRNTLRAAMVIVGLVGGKEVYCPPPGLKGGQVMTTLDQFLASNPNMAERTYGDAMGASLTRAFPCQTR
jgi:hypothetical protein